MAEDSGSAAGAVEISSWNLYGRESEGDGWARMEPDADKSGAMVLVGPIVGAVTDTTARVLIEVASELTVTMEAFMDDESVCVISQDLLPKTPAAFQLENFEPGKRIRVTVTVGEEEEVREARFTCTNKHKNKWKIATVSCNCHSHTEEIRLWNRLARVVGDVDCILHLGDQVYGDSDFGTKESGEPFESAWHASLTLLEPVDREEWDSYKEEVREFYREAYRTTWNVPHTAICLASTANYMICDDHEFTDDLGDGPDHANPTSLAYYVAVQAYQVYNEYQHQLLEDCDVTDLSLKPYYSFKLSPRVGFFMTDNRVERSLHRGHGSEESWANRHFMGPEQWEKVKDAFENDFANCDVVLFGTPTPLVFLSQRATGLAVTQMDDALGTWGHSDFKTEQEALTGLLTEWQNGGRNRALITLGGDVHMGGFTDSWHNGSSVPLHQLTASAVGNRPEGNMNILVETALRNAMYADQGLFEFQVKHYDWIYGPNYGMIDFKMTEQGHGRHRPKVTLTLVGEKGAPKIRNLQFGNDDIDIGDADHSPASKSAHETAEIMAVSPFD